MTVFKPEYAGEIRKHFKRGLKLQLGALGLVVNVIILWNTDDVGAILGLLEVMGRLVFNRA